MINKDDIGGYAQNKFGRVLRVTSMHPVHSDWWIGEDGNNYKCDAWNPVQIVPAGGDQECEECARLRQEAEDAQEMLTAAYMSGAHDAKDEIKRLRAMCDELANAVYKAKTIEVGGSLWCGVECPFCGEYVNTDKEEGPLVHAPDCIVNTVLPRLAEMKISTDED